MKAAELRRRTGLRPAARMRGVVVELDYDDLKAVARDMEAEVDDVFVCVNDDAMNVALGHEAARSFPDARVCVRMSSLQSGIGLLMSTRPAVPRLRFVGFHDAAKNVSVLRRGGSFPREDSTPRPPHAGSPLGS